MTAAFGRRHERGRFVSPDLRSQVRLRPAATPDVELFERWDRDPDVIAATSDDPNADKAFADAYWQQELSTQSPLSFYLVAELNQRPIGAMQIIDPLLEPTHYWGDCEPYLRAIDIWIGEADARDLGYGTAMMRQAINRCFAEPVVTAIVIDPLTSNTRVHRFYQRLGFQPVGRRSFGGDDCLVHRLERCGMVLRKGSP